MGKGEKEGKQQGQQQLEIGKNGQKRKEREKKTRRNVKQRNRALNGRSLEQEKKERRSELDILKEAIVSPAYFPPLCLFFASSSPPLFPPSASKFEGIEVDLHRQFNGNLIKLISPRCQYRRSRLPLGFGSSLFMVSLLGEINPCSGISFFVIRFLCALRSSLSLFTLSLTLCLVSTFQRHNSSDWGWKTRPALVY